MVPPKKSEKKEPKKRTGDGQMGYLRTRSTRENALDKKKGIKKMKDQLRYLMKKELAGMLSSKEKKIKKSLQKSLGMK